VTDGEPIWNRPIGSFIREAMSKNKMAIRAKAPISFVVWLPLPEPTSLGIPSIYLAPETPFMRGEMALRGMLGETIHTGRTSNSYRHAWGCWRIAQAPHAFACSLGLPHRSMADIASLPFSDMGACSTGANASKAGRNAYAPLGRIRTNFVPQVGHVPCRDGRPLRMVTGCGSTISFVALHLTQ